MRLTYSLELIRINPIVEEEAVKANPSLFGTHAMHVFDKTVSALTNQGVAVILNNHISDAMWCCSPIDGNGLWHNPEYSADYWENAIVGLSQRYQDNKLVIGNDLRNEIRDDTLHGYHESWGTGNEKTDWKMAATRAANRLLDTVPDSLVFIEGLNYANKMDMIRDEPIQLAHPNKLVYSFHIYSWQNMVSYDSYEDFCQTMEAFTGFILEEDQAYTAPLWLGEFGENNPNTYWQFLTRWLSENPTVGWAYWAWNGYKTDPTTDESYGIMNADMVTVRDEWKLQDLQAIQDYPQGTFT